MGTVVTPRPGTVGIGRPVPQGIDTTRDRPLGWRGRVASYIPIACLLLVILAAGGLRMVRLDSWPVFTDEDGYTQAAIATRGASLRAAIETASRITTKPPLPFLAQGSLIRAGLDPVVAGRLMSAAAGTVTTALCFLLGKRLSGTAVGLLTALAYAVSPMAVLHERMVLQDGPVSMFALGALLAAWRAVEHPSLWFGALAGLLGALAVQFKPPGVASAFLPVFVFALAGTPWRPRVLPAVLAAAGPLLSYGVLTFGPVGAMIQDQNRQLLSPFAFIPQNLESLTDSVDAYFPAGFGFLVLLGAGLGFLSDMRRNAVPVVAMLIWIVPWIVLSRFSPARYYLPPLPYVLAIAGLGLVRLVAVAGRLRALAGLLCAAAFVYWTGSSSVDSVRLVGDYATARMSGLDSCQYRSCWPSGYGYGDAARFVSTAAQSGDKVAYFVDHGHIVGAGFFASLPAGVQSLGMLAADSRLVPENGRVLAIVDDGRDGPAGAKLSQVLTLHPGWRVLARFPRPRSDGAVTVLSSAPE